MSKQNLKLLFVVAGLYDIILGGVFLFFHDAIFETLGMALVGHPTYAQFPSLLVFIFGVMFLHISTNPVLLRPMIPYGMAMKAAFTGVAIWSLLTVGLPTLWIPAFVADLAFLILFFMAWNATAEGQELA